MNNLKAGELALVVNQLQLLCGQCEFPIVHNRGADRIDEELVKKFSQTLTLARELCKTVKLTESLRQFDLAAPWLLGSPSPTFLEAEPRFTNLTETLIVELQSRRFLFVESDFSEYVDNQDLFGSGVSLAFPLAKPDILEAGNCLAGGCYTASVFHLMRAVEWALRALCDDLGIKKLKAQKKSGKIKLTPVSHSQWEHILARLQKRVDSKLSKLRPGPTKQKHQEFYISILQEFDWFKDAWRNHTMHGRKSFLREDAVILFHHVKRFMAKLATKASEKLEKPAEKTGTAGRS